MKVGDVFRALSPAWKEVLRRNTLGAARVITIQRQQWTFVQTKKDNRQSGAGLLRASLVTPAHV